MKEFDVATKIIKLVAYENVPFALALRSTFKKLSVDPEVRGTITALVGCELRHHLIFESLTKKALKVNDELALVPTYLCLANILFLKRLKNDECIKLAKEAILLADSSFDTATFDKFIKWAKSTNEFIPSDLAKDSPEYLSYRYNTPSWIINMWQKQFGKGIACNILKSNYHPAKTTLRINNLVVSDSDILKNNDFAPTEIKGIVSYEGKSNLKASSVFTSNSVFFQKMATKYVIDSLELDPYQKIAIYASYPNNIILDLAVRFGHLIEVDAMVDHLQTYLENKKAIHDYSLTNVHLYETNVTSSLTCLASEVDVFFLLPKNSCFDLLRSTPDYFLRANQNDLDGFIEGQNIALNEAKKLVSLNGRIVYLIPTISNKEGHGLIANFINQNPDFTLEAEKQFFPFESLDSCLYYAVIRKIKND